MHCRVLPCTVQGNITLLYTTVNHIMFLSSFRKWKAFSVLPGLTQDHFTHQYETYNLERFLPRLFYLPSSNCLKVSLNLAEELNLTSSESSILLPMMYFTRPESAGIRNVMSLNSPEYLWVTIMRLFSAMDRFSNFNSILPAGTLITKTQDLLADDKLPDSP